MERFKIQNIANNRFAVYDSEKSKVIHTDVSRYMCELWLDSYKPDYPAIMRIETETKLPVVFFPETLDRYGNLDCYAHIGQHSAASYEYFLKGTKPINKYNPLTEEQTTAMIDLVNEVCGIYENGEDAVKIVWKKRISRK